MGRTTAEQNAVVLAEASRQPRLELRRVHEAGRLPRHPQRGMVAELLQLVDRPRGILSPIDGTDTPGRNSGRSSDSRTIAYTPGFVGEPLATFGVKLPNGEEPFEPFGLEKGARTGGGEMVDRASGHGMTLGEPRLQLPRYVEYPYGLTSSGTW